MRHPGKIRFDATIPATSVTQEVRDQMDEIRREQGVSHADIVRAALAFYLPVYLNEIQVIESGKRKASPRKGKSSGRSKSAD